MSKHGLFPRMAAPVERTPVGAPASVLGVRSVNPSNIWRQFGQGTPWRETGEPDHWMQGNQPDAGAYITPRGQGTWGARLPNGLIGGFEGGAGAGAGVPGMGGAGANLGGAGRGSIRWTRRGLELDGSLAGRLGAAAKWLPWAARAGIGGALGGKLVIRPDGTVETDGSLGGYTDALASGPGGTRGPGTRGQVSSGYGNFGGPGGPSVSRGLRPGRTRPVYCDYLPNAPGCP